MSAFPSSAIGLPQSLKYELPPSLPDSARAYSVNISPDGITSVAGTANNNAIFVANSTGAFGNFSSQVVSFTIPSGMSDSVFLDPASTSLSFTMSYTTNATANSTTNSSLNLIGSGASWFDQLVLYSNNTPIETVNQYGLLQNFMLQNTVNFSERYGGLSICMGCDSAGGYNGIELGAVASTTYKYSFTIPLLSVIGANSDKFIPVGSINNLQLQMTTANLVPFVSYCTAVTTTPTMGSVTLADFTLNMKYVDVGDMAGALLKQTLQDGKWFIKSQTYTNSAVNIPNGSIGAQQLLLQIRNTSVKSIMHQFSASSSASTPNGAYDAINISLNTRQCQVGGNFYPNKPINDMARPSEGYPYLIQALTQGGGITKSYGTVVARDMYLTNISALTGLNADSSYTITSANGLRSTASGADSTYDKLAKYPASFYCGYDLEKSSGILFQGVNTRAQPPFLNLNIGTATPVNTICQAWGLSDVILQVDTVAKQVTAFI
jgi:hypothetical protein